MIFRPKTRRDVPCGECMITRLRRSVVVVALILSGCSSEQSPQPGSPQSKSGEPSTVQPPSAGLPVASPMLGTGKLVPPKNDDEFIFVVFGDNRPAKGEPQPETIKEIFKEVSELKPAFALSLGDVIEGKPKPNDPDAIDTIRNQFKDFLALAVTAGVPIFNAPGNHEMDDDQDIPTDRMHNLYHECAGSSYGAFTYGNSRFIVLNTEDIPSSDTPKPPKDQEFSYMNPKQIAELKSDLDANRDKKHIFITMHYPIHAKNQGPPISKWDDRLYPESRKALVELFKDYDNIAYVLAAHEHLYYNPQSPDDVTDVPGWKTGDPIVFLVSGGAGAPLNTGMWGFHHYLVFAVEGDSVSVKLVKLQSAGASS
jgi:hypothetical protein